jgi:hypothetical protein
MSTVASESLYQDNDIPTVNAKPAVRVQPKVVLTPEAPPEAPRSCFTFGDLGNALGFGLLYTLFPLCTQRGPTAEEDNSGARDASRRFGI